jgi:replicative DNA helicase
MSELYDVALEEKVLGTIFVDDSTYPMVRAALADSEWYDPRHRLIWAAIEETAAARMPINTDTVFHRITDKGQLNRVGNWSYLNDLTSLYTTKHVLPTYTDRLAKLAKIRAVIDMCQRTVTDATNCKPERITALLETVMSRTLDLVREGRGTTVVPVAQDVEAITKAFNSGGGMKGIIPTGFPTLDRMTNGGLAPRRVTVLAAEAGSGKSTLLNTIATNAALAGKRTLIFSLEDSRHDWHSRTLARLADLPYAAFLDADQRTMEMPERLRVAGELLAACPLFACDSTSMTSGDALATAMVHRAEQGLDLVVVDHLIEFTDRADSTHLRVTAAVKNMRRLAIELGIPVLVATQLNREGKLRESGSIEEVARAVWRMETDADPSEDRSGDHERPVNRRLRIVKSNYGKKGTVNLWADFGRFYMREWSAFTDGEFTWAAKREASKSNAPSTYYNPNKRKEY